MAVMTVAIATGCTESKSSQDTDSLPIKPTGSNTTIVTTTATQSAATKHTPVEIVDTCNLRIYYPNYSRIDLVCGEMPKKSNDSVILVCVAAYTAKCLDHFDHGNIIGNHVSGGKLYNGAPMNVKKGEKACYRGAFSFYDGKPHFAYDNWNGDFRMAATKGGCGFAQDMMLHKGGIVNHWREDSSRNLFRALCLIDGKVAVADAKEILPFRDFIQNLINAGATEAIYLDMGGWKHSWRRDADGNAIDIHPSPTKYATNWITFYK